MTHLEGSGTADDFMAQRRLVRVVRVIVLRSHKRRVSVAILLRAVSDALTHLVGQLSLVRIIIEPTHGVYHCCVKRGYRGVKRGGCADGWIDLQPGELLYAFDHD